MEYFLQVRTVCCAIQGRKLDVVSTYISNNVDIVIYALDDNVEESDLIGEINFTHIIKQFERKRSKAILRK